MGERQALYFEISNQNTFKRKTFSVGIHLIFMYFGQSFLKNPMQWIEPKNYFEDFKIYQIYTVL